MISVHKPGGFVMISIISSLAAGTFLALTLSPTTTHTQTTETSVSGEGLNVTQTINHIESARLKTDSNENRIETTPTITPTIVPPEVKPIQDITSTMGTIRTTIDESQERIKAIVNDRIEGALGNRDVVLTAENTEELKTLRENIMRDIKLNIATITPALPVETQELKKKINEKLKKIDELTSEIKKNTSTTSNALPGTEPKTKVDEKIRHSINDQPTTSTPIPKEVRHPDQALIKDKEIESAPDTQKEITVEERKPMSPAESARQINRLIDGLVETVATQSKAFKEQGGDKLFQDSNQDGVSDYESVHLYGIDPVAPAPVSIYEGREITSEEKILLGFDPAKTDLVKIQYEEPKQSSYITPAYTVDTITLTPQKTIEIKGRALPNSFVTIYIYSTPIIVTVKTDEHGEWEYTLEKELEDGRHTLYTASVSGSGKILARSSPVLFVKTAEAAAIEEIFVATPTNAQPRVLGSRDIFFIITAVLGIILVAINIIGAKSKNDPTN